MHVKHKTSALFPKQGDQNAKGQKKHIDKEQGKTEHEATQNKNNMETTALERSVVYTTGGFKGISLYKLHPGSRYNSKYKKYIKGSVRIMAS